MSSNKIADKITPVTDLEWASVNGFNRKIVEEYLEESVSLSDETLKQYRSSLRIFCRWIKENLEDIPITQVKSRDYLRYQNWLTRRGLSSSGVKLKRSTVSSLNNYIVLYYEDLYPTFKNFITKAIKSPEPVFVHDKLPLTPDEFNNLIKVLEEKEEWQKIAYLKFSYSTGCRRTETSHLLKEVADYPLVVKEKKIKNEDGIEEDKTAKYYVTHDIRCKGKSKVGSVRKLKFDEDTMLSIKKWLEVRGEDDCPYVFVSNYGKKINQINVSSFNDWCSGLFTEIVGRRVHPHLTRESKATNMVLYSGKDIKVAQSLLGHKSSTTTEIYVIRDNSEDGDEAFLD